jgi:hypothetical protein
MIDSLLSTKRDAAAAKRFFRKALRQSHTVNPRAITVDKNAAYPIATKAMKRTGELWPLAKLLQVKFLNNIVEQDHRRIKRLVRPGLRFKSFTTASRAIAGYEAMAVLRKGQVVHAPANDMGAQRDFIAVLFGTAARPEVLSGSRVTYVRVCNGTVETEDRQRIDCAVHGGRSGLESVEAIQRCDLPPSQKVDDHTGCLLYQVFITYHDRLTRGPMRAMRAAAGL